MSQQSSTLACPRYRPQHLPYAQAYPIAIDAGGIAEGTVTAAACPTRLTHTLSHGAASPVCKDRKELKSRTTFIYAIQDGHPLQWASGSSVIEAAPQFSGIFSPVSCLLLKAE